MLLVYLLTLLFFIHSIDYNFYGGQHPQLYERAFIDRTVGGKFTSAADLWSLGATIAHAILGEVPFRPFEGTRKNRNEMLVIKHAAE